MSRTIKDSRIVKEAKPRRKKDSFKRRYLKVKQEGFSEDLMMEENCPECNGLTDFAHGVFICGDCDWNGAGVKALNFSNPFFKKAA